MLKKVTSNVNIKSREQVIEMKVEYGESGTSRNVLLLTIMLNEGKWLSDKYIGRI